MVKPQGRHPHNRLTDLAVRKKTKPGRYADGNGLYLIVEESGAKRWILRTMIRGKRCDLGLGSASTTSLADARVEAARLRRAARTGADPMAARRRERRAVLTFRVCAKKVHEQLAPTFRNPKHRAQWWSSLEMYAFPFFGDRDVDAIEPADVLKALSPIWTDRRETAQRVRQRIKTVLDWAKAAGHRQGDNAVDGVAKALPKSRRETKHHKAMPYREVGAFIHGLREFNTSESMRLGLEFMILTAARTKEIHEARPEEIDFESKIWTVPAERMKAHRLHRVPLSDRCIEIVRRAIELSDGGPYLFPSLRQSKPWSNNAFLSVLKRMGCQDVTGHGFRTTFRTWASELQPHVGWEVVEMALAHVVKNKTAAAYFRTDLVELRKGLMDSWSEFATRRPDESGRVIAFSA